MEAHALTARMVEKVKKKNKLSQVNFELSQNFKPNCLFLKVDFPFLVLLVSGGHCLLAVVKNVDEFLLLGESIDCAPGEVLDKVWFTYFIPHFNSRNYLFVC